MEFINNEEVEFMRGNMSDVYRKDDVVYRLMKPQSKTIHRLLLHLEKKKIDFTPRFIGIDEEKYHEKLSLVKGQTLNDYPTRNDINYKIEIIRRVAKLLKEYHDATVDFERQQNDIWFLKYNGNLDLDVICHNDFAPYNTTFIDDKPVGIIDFDTACPAPRMWDIAYSAYRFVPLSMEVYVPEEKIYRKYDKNLDSLERKILLKEFIKAYGIESITHVMDNVILRLQALVKLFDDECEKGNKPFIKMKEEGHQEFYIKEIKFIKENMQEWL